MVRAIQAGSIRFSRYRGALAAALLAGGALLAGAYMQRLPAHAASSPGPLAASLVAGAPAQVGVPETLTYTATNTTATSISGIVVIPSSTTDTVTLASLQQAIKVVQPAGLVCVLRHFECLLSAPLAPGDSIIMTLTFTPLSLDTLTTTVVNVFTPTGGTDVSNQVDLLTPVSPGPTDVQVTGFASTGSPARGATFTYTFQVKNNGPEPAYAVTFGDPLPAAVSLVGVQTSAGSCAQAAGTVNCSLGDLAVGAQATVVITVVAPAAPSTFTNTASVGSGSPDRQPSNNSVGVTVQVK